MDQESHEGAADQIPLPIASSYPPMLHEAPKMRLMAGPGGSGNGLGEASNGLAAAGDGHEVRFLQMEVLTVRKPVKYRECLKNYAASLGGHATDGCGEFMPSGEEGTLEALKCAACGCHRNFHRREAEDEPAACSDCGQLARRDKFNRLGPLLPITPHAPPLALPPTSLLPRPPPSQMIMALSVGRSESDDQDAAFLSSPPTSSSSLRKRFRTKFTAEQKEKMLELAEKLGWRFQKQEEQSIQQFCTEVGVKRQVLKVWMHNNKHTLGKKPL